MTRHCSAIAAGTLAILLGACSGNAGEQRSNPRFDSIAAEETFRFLGNEPFWGGETAGETLTYTTPDDPEGTVIAVKRFSGMNGMSLSGELAGAPFDMIVTEEQCNDTMSDRSYPFTVVLSIGDDVRNGCGWTDAVPFTGPANP